MAEEKCTPTQGWLKEVIDWREEEASSFFDSLGDLCDTKNDNFTETPYVCSAETAGEITFAPIILPMYLAHYYPNHPSILRTPQPTPHSTPTKRAYYDYVADTIRLKRKSKRRRKSKRK